MDARLLLSVGVGVLGGAAAAPSLYLAGLSIAALGRRPTAQAVPGTGAKPVLAVLVPAHNEALLIGRCLDSLGGQDYPVSRREYFVIADNCTDDTADLARDRGATVLERRDTSAPGKGPALRWAIDRLLLQRPDIDAFVVVDADSITDPAMLTALADIRMHGAEVVQADYEALVAGSDPRSQLRAAAFLLFHRVRFSGKARLGLSCNLVGNGMLFSRDVCRRVPWTAFSEVEDLEYGLILRLAGVDIVFAPDAHLVAPVATDGPAAEVQRTRWESGRARVTKQYLPRLVRAAATRGRIDLWDAAADLAVPPLGLLAGLVITGAGTAVVLRASGVIDSSAVAPWLIASAAIPAHVLIGLRAAEAPPTMLSALIEAPRQVGAEMAVRLRAARQRGREPQWVRTPRAMGSA